AAVFVNSAAELPDPSGISCLALSGAGADYFEKSPKTPLLLFTWLDPALVPREVAVMFDDSPLALAAPAARMAAAGLAEGQIPSKPLILAAKTAGRGITRQLKNSVKKTPERQQNQAETLTNN
ncbi:MAG: hypothetical protein FWH38_07815, partial [Treponema sp.]|nr:hypothetical protein [Treponema sp.]